MKRRSFLKGAAATGAVAAAATASSFPKPALSQNSQELKMVTSWPRNFPGLGTGAARVGERLAAASNGRYTVRVFAGGELVGALQCNDAVQQGTAEMYHSADYYYGGKAKGYLFMTAVPFGFTPNEMDAWIQHGGGQALWDEVGAQFGVKHLPGGNSGCQMGGWFRNPIRSVSDLQGLKMRIPGLGGAVINALGGSATTLPGAEIMPALQSGRIDATEWVGPWNDLAFGFYRVVRYYHYPGFHEPGSMLSVGISKQLWDGLSDTDKALFENACLAENNHDFAEFNANNTAALDTLINEHNVELVEFPDEVFQAIGQASEQVLAETGQADDLTKRVYDSFMAFRRTALRWTKLSDQSYANKRELHQF